MRFQKHYTRSEARALLPEIQKWLEHLNQLRALLEECDQQLAALRTDGCEVGGPLVNKWVRTLADIKDLLLQFHRREIQLKDVERGLIDFPAMLDGREVFLCWEKGEEDIEFWHDLDTGYAGREPLEDEGGT